MKTCIVAAALCGCLSAGVFAGTAETNTIPDRIVVTATRKASGIREIPSNPTVITAQDIDAGHYTSVSEVLSKKAGLHFSNYADNPSQAQINLRGFAGDSPHGKVLVLLNGRKLNRPDQASINWAQIPLQSVEKIEVVRGPGSVLYGDHAVGGVVNIITRDGSEEPQLSLRASAGSHRAADQNAVATGTLSGLRYAAALGHQSGDGYRDRSRYDTVSGSLRLSGNLNERISAYTEISAVKEQHQLPGGLSPAQVQQNRRQSVNPGDDAKSEYFSFHSGIEAFLTDEMVFSLDGAVSRKDLISNMDSAFNYTDYRIDGSSLSPKFTWLAPVAGMNNQLVFGTDLARETLRVKRYGTRGRTTPPAADTKVTKELIGGYLTDTLSLTDRLLLNGGVRVEQNRVTAGHEGVTPYRDQITHREEAWQTSLTWLPTDTVKLFTGAARTYRYPFTDEQAGYWGFGWGDAFNKDLKPETGINYEAGIEFTPFTNLVLQATLFQTDMKDEIAWGGIQNENLDETTRRGAELYAGYKNDSFALDGFYTWLQPEFKTGADSGNRIPWVPRNNLNLNLSLFLTESLTFGSRLSYIGSMFPLGDNSNSSADRQKAYTLVDLHIEYTLPIRACSASVFSGIDNLFGKKYNYLVTDYGWGSAYYPAPERTYRAGLSMTF